MLGLTHELEMLGAVPAGATDTVQSMAKTLAQHGYRPLLINAGEKTPAETRTDAALKKATKAAQEVAKEKGNPHWQQVRAGGGGIHLAIDTPAHVKRAYTAALARQPRDEYGHSLPLNLALALNGEKVVIVDTDTAEATAAFMAMCEDWGISVPHPTVLSPGVQDSDGRWVHSKGGHFYFAVPENVSFADYKSFDIGEGAETISFMVTNKYVLIPPSQRAEGAYRWLGGVHTMPAAMADLIREQGKRRNNTSDKTNTTAAAAPGNHSHAPSPHTPPPAIDIDADDIQAALHAASDGDIDAWAAATPWAELLTRHGWTEARQLDRCGCPIWTAPGTHGSPKSATAHEAWCTQYDTTAGHAPLHLWTDNPPAELAGNRTWSKLQYLAATEHAGDEVQAMLALSIEPRDQHDYNDLPAFAPLATETAAPAVEHTPQTTAQTTPAFPTTARIRCGNVLPGFGAAPSALTATAPATAGDTPGTTVDNTAGATAAATDPTTATAVATNPATAGDTELPAGVTDLCDKLVESTISSQGNNYDDDLPRDIAVHDGVHGVMLSHREKDILDRMVAEVNPYLTEPVTNSQRIPLAAMIRRGENPYDTDLYPYGAPYAPELVHQIFSASPVLRRIFTVAVKTNYDHGIALASPVNSLCREMVRVLHRAPVGMRTWQDTPLALYVVNAGEPGKGKSASTNMRMFSPWPDPNEYGYLPTRPAPGSTAVDTAGVIPDDSTADTTESGASGQSIPAMITETVMEEDDTGEVDDDGAPIMEMKKTSRLIPHPSLILQADELETWLAISAGPDSTLISTLNSAYSGAPIGATRANGDTTRTRGAYRIQVQANMQIGRFHEVLRYAGTGFPHRMLLALVTWPWGDLPWKILHTDPVPAPAITLPVEGRMEVAESVLTQLRTAALINAGIAMESNPDEALKTHQRDLQARVACAGALLHSSTYVSHEMWTWAGAVIEVSRRTMALVDRVGEQKRIEAVQKKGEELAVAQAASKTFTRHTHETAFKTVREYLAENGPSTFTALHKRVSSSVRGELRGLLDQWTVHPALGIKKVGKKYALI